MKVWNFIRNNIYIRNLLLAAIILLGLITLVLWWLDGYTQHGKAVEVPDVRGLQVSEAAPFFEKNALKYAVIDSTFFKNVAPGSIVETVPPKGTKVKEGRLIYLTINSFSSQTFVVPDVRDLSQRQALAMLQAVGFESVQVRQVPGNYRDLVVGIENKGMIIPSGERIPSGSKLTVLVSSGEGAVEEAADSVIINDSLEESWF